MKKKFFLTTIIIFFVLLSTFLFFSLNSCHDLRENNFNYDNTEVKELTEILNPKSAASTDLNYSSIRQNATIIRRVFESINFTIDVFGFNDVNYTEIQFDFSNNTVKKYNMTHKDTRFYNYTYKPEYNAPLGFQVVSFRLFNKTKGPLNTQTTKTNFTIIPSSVVGFNSSIGYFRSQFLLANLIVNDSIDTWKISVVNEKNRAQTKEKNIANNTNQIKLEIDNWFVNLNSLYYIKVNLSQGNKWADEYFEFKVLNNNPIIVVSTISFSPNSVYRTEGCVVSLNVSDVENNSNPAFMNVTMHLEDPEGTEDIYSLDNNKDKSFQKSFSVGKNKPAGNYKVNLTVKDRDRGTYSYYTYLTIKNNPPEILGFKINDFTMNDSISINYGEDLVFKFNVSDIEGIAYIKVALIDENNKWFNITNEYQENMSITVRTVDLLTGTWYVYVFVTDTDGATVGLEEDYNEAPQQITIIPEILSGALPWIAFFIGIAIGTVLGIVAVYRKIKSKILEAQAIEIKKKKAIPKKLAGKKKSEQQKIVEAKKELQKPEKERAELETKQAEPEEKEPEPEKKEPRKVSPQRKIKRKL